MEPGQVEVFTSLQFASDQLILEWTVTNIYGQNLMVETSYPSIEM
jgi:hypothetical protein